MSEQGWKYTEHELPAACHSSTRDITAVQVLSASHHHQLDLSVLAHHRITEQLGWNRPKAHPVPVLC